MAQDDDDKHWYDDDRLYSSGRDSDDSPLLSHRSYEKRHYEPYTLAKTEERERRSPISVLMKFFLFCTAMILFCVLLYIPVYNRANDQISKALVAGWTTHTNRDTKLYVLPNNVTIIHEPTDICHKEDRAIKNKLFLLIVVCSSTENFERRIAIRDSWGNQSKYIDLAKIFNKTRDRYKNYNYTYDLYTQPNNSRQKRAAGFAEMLPEIQKILQNNLIDSKTDNVPEKRFDEDDGMLPQFEMNEVLGDEVDANYYDDSNVMKIPPRGYEDNPDLGKLLSLLKKDKHFPKVQENGEPGSTAVDFKLVFLLGLPASRNDSDVQDRIEEEIDKYKDVIQEGFTDSYNNLTLKSIMMLKWINNNCNESVRYILKTDDDMYVNVPNLVANLRNRSKDFDTKLAKGHKGKEYMLIGDLICGARPVLDSTNKWYSPRYMFGARVYPRYVSGTGYALSAPAAAALYAAALRTPYFHLEDIYITGICAARASPRLPPRDDPAFSYSSIPPTTCAAHARVTSHRVTSQHMLEINSALMQPDIVDRCERIRLTQVRKDRLRPKTSQKKLTKHHH